MKITPSQCSNDQLADAVRLILNGRGNPQLVRAVLDEVGARYRRLYATDAQTPPGSDERLIERLEKWASIAACEDPFLDGGEDAGKTLYGEAADRLRSLLGERAEAGMYTEAHRLLDEDARERVAAAEASLLRVTEERDALATQTWDSMPKQESLDIETRARAVHAAFMAETARRADVERELEEKSANEVRLASRCRELELLLDSEARRRKYLSGELGEYERREVYRAGKDHRTPQAQKWPDDYIPPTTCGNIDDVQNALESIRDTNSQLRHVAYHALASLSALRGEAGKVLGRARDLLREAKGYDVSHTMWTGVNQWLADAASLLSTLEGNTSSRTSPSAHVAEATATEALISTEIFSFEAQLAERRADPAWIAKWNAAEDDARPFHEMLNDLRRDEGSAVTLLCDNPDFNGQPNNAIECVGGWTDWQERRFTGETLHAALKAAYLARRTALSSAEGLGVNNNGK